MELQFAVFQDEGRGPSWRASFTEIGEAKRLAQTLADKDNREFFVYNFDNYSEIARSYPTRIEIPVIESSPPQISSQVALGLFPVSSFYPGYQRSSAELLQKREHHS